MHRLALALGKTLGELASMDESEFRSWKAYYDLEPFGDSGAWYRQAAGLAAITQRPAVEFLPDGFDVKQGGSDGE